VAAAGGFGMPRGLAQHVNAGTVAIEEARAIAEAQGKLIVAKKFPRDPARAWASIMEACKRPGLAAIAEYSFPRGTERVTGPSIRLAEELARCWGNIDYGIRELSRKDGVSEMEAYAWDLETNTMSSQKFTVRHIRDTKHGGKELKDERDIYELTANMAGRRLRARIMAILPADIVDGAVAECRKTLAGKNTAPMADRVRTMLSAFEKFGVTAAHLERYLDKPLGEILGDDFAELTSIYNSIKDGVAKPGDYFDGAKVGGEAPAAEDINAKIRQAQTQAPAAPAPAAPAAQPEPQAQPAPPAAPAEVIDPSGGFAPGTHAKPATKTTATPAAPARPPVAPTKAGPKNGGEDDGTVF
jgi:hypothetical protein